MFFTQLYIQLQYKYLHVHKKTLNEKKKCLRFFNKKRPLYAELGLKQKTFSNWQATYQKELFSQTERTDKLDPPLPLFVLVCFLRTPLHDACTF